MTTLSRDGDVFVLDLGDTENRFDAGRLAALGAALDEVEAAEGPKALVTTGSGKFWSNGLDLEWLAGHQDQAGTFIDGVCALLARTLTLPLATSAAVQGHCFGAGALLALAHDTRLQREDRGFFCLPEVDIGLPFTPGMGALVQSRLTPATALEAMTTARRYGGADAAAAGIASAALPQDRLLPEAVARAQALAGKAGPTLGTIKARMFPEVVALLSAPQ